ncbi:hypothetical protein QOZ80_6BG0462300 [Eleusine coracana subsp. coracana]|nr:hypothetical protein QOZ80_6BG0462300 [Eleusine coracana subsp. coracana]
MAMELFPDGEPVSPSASSLTSAPPPRIALELFPDGEHVRLQSRDRRGMYLHADEDGVGVSVGPVRASLHVAWKVHLRFETDGSAFVHLHNAAYGRYLKATEHAAPRGHLGKRVVQGDYDLFEEDAVAWRPVTVADADGEILLHHVSSNSFLRANGKYCRWRTAVSVDVENPSYHDTMTHWLVEAIPATSSTPELPPPSPTARPGGFWNWIKFLFLTAPVEETRNIRLMLAAGDGSINPEDGGVFPFQGRSVSNLRSLLANRLSGGIEDNIKLCVLAGDMGRMIPLITDLPWGKDIVYIVVVSTSAPSKKLCSFLSGLM